jgi:hypothetical protein
MGPAAQAVGIQAPYINTSLPFGTVNVTPIALQMKAKDVDSLYGPIDPNTLLALITAAQQTGINLKVSDMSTGYGEDFLTDPSALHAAQGAFMITNGQVPVELKTAATQTEQAAFAKYQGFSGVPNFGWTQGYASADLLIKGLQEAGQNPTRSSFITNLRKVTSYNVSGLASNTVNFAAVQNIANQQCSYYVQLKNRQFTVQNNNKPICGTLVKQQRQQNGSTIVSSSPPARVMSAAAGLPDRSAGTRSSQTPPFRYAGQATDDQNTDQPGDATSLTHEALPRVLQEQSRVALRLNSRADRPTRHVPTVRDCAPPAVSLVRRALLVPTLYSRSRPRGDARQRTLA